MSDLIERQAAIEALRAMQTYKMFAGDDLLLIDQAGAQTELMMLPSTQSKTNCSEFPNNSDAISRQAAIDSMCELMRHWFGCDSKDEIREIKRELGKLPSAQPEPCEDAVSRQRLLSDLKELTAAWGKYPVMEEQIKGVETAIGYVETIPSAQPERKKGKWIPLDEASDEYECDVCRTTYDTVCGTWDLPYFCPHCGADMRGGEDERLYQQGGCRANG